MKSTQRNVAYIDGANLHKGISRFSWKFDYARFRVWLREKYGVEQAYLFLGMIPRYKDLYTKLQEQGYTLVYKEVVYDNDGKAKGNCDADVVVHAMRDSYEKRFDGVVIVASDGDYAPLVKFLIERQEMVAIVSPYGTSFEQNGTDRCSILLKRTGAKIAYIADQKTILVLRKEKAPDADGTA